MAIEWFQTAAAIGISVGLIVLLGLVVRSDRRHDAAAMREVEASCDRLAGRIGELLQERNQLRRERDEAREVCHAIRRAMQGEGDLILPPDLVEAIVDAMTLSAGLDGSDGEGQS